MLSPGQFLARAQAGGDSKRVEGEAVLEAGEQRVQGEGSAEGGVASLCLDWTSGQEPVDGLDGSATGSRALQQQTQALHGLQGDLPKDHFK